MGWLIALGILVFLGILPLGVSVLYDAKGPVIRLLTGPAKWKVYPQKKKDKPKKEKKPKKKKKKDPAPGEAAAQDPGDAKRVDKKSGAAPAGKEKKPAKKEKGGPITDFLPLVYVGLDLLADVPRLFRIHRLDLNLVLGGSDPADLGENYGKACAALGNLWPRLEEVLVIRRRDVKLQCDFEASETLITARLDISVTLARVLGFGLRYGFRAIYQFIKITYKRKGGAEI